MHGLVSGKERLLNRSERLADRVVERGLEERENTFTKEVNRKLIISIRSRKGRLSRL